MSLTMEQAREILSKVTVMSEGLFQETASRNAGKMVCKTFYCDVEGDDYNVLINGDKVIEINNSATKWSQAVIENLLNPPVREEAPDIPQFSGGVSMANPTVAPTTYTNMPTAIPTLIVNASYVQAFIASFVTLNPGCVLSLFSPGGIASEVPAQDPNAWVLRNIDLDDNLQTFGMYCENATDQSIAEQVTAELVFDTNTNTFVSVLVEG